MITKTKPQYNIASIYIFLFFDYATAHRHASLFQKHTVEELLAYSLYNNSKGLQKCFILISRRTPI